MSDIDNPLAAWYERQEEPNRSCFFVLREFILGLDPEITEAWKYRMPMFLFRGKMYCYLWQEKKGWPYVGIVHGGKIEHPALVQGKRSKMKILRIDPGADLPLDTLADILEATKIFYPNR
ncbi:MAG: DUF1801 domain-containing protein [Bacteroidota bacterium]